MNGGNATRRLDGWRAGEGVCYICGECIKAPRRAPQQQQSPSYYCCFDATAVENELSSIAGNHINIIGSDILVEECPIRLCLLRFNMLGEYQEAHLIDDYTFLDGHRTETKKGSFWQKFEQQYDEGLHHLNPIAFERFKTQVPGDILAKATATMARAVSNRTVPACQPCNRAMYRLYEHTLAVYRCFHVTSESESALMESRTNPAHKARKVLQQIALFFDYDGINWKAKTSDAILLDGVLWRCIAFLHCWGQTGGIQMRLIAIFYASFYVYTKCSSLQNPMRFEDWHTHVWRPMCCTCFAPGTFLGMGRSSAVGRIDLSRSKTGPECVRIVSHFLCQNIGDSFLAQWECTLTSPEHHLPYGKYYDFFANKRYNNNTKEEDIAYWRQACSASVRDERSLLIFLCDRRGSTHGIERLLYFFCYNYSIIDPKENAVLLRFKNALQNIVSGILKQKNLGGGDLD